MPYCHQCGKKNSERASFCEHCGINIKEFLEETEKEAEKIVKKTSTGKFIFLIIVLIFIGYIILDIWAATQVRPDISLDNLWTVISNLKGSAGATSASGSTSIILNNPTFVPLFLFPITYKLEYGSTEIASGQTSIIFIPPNSNNNIDTSVEISYMGAGSAALQGIFNSITGNTQSLRLDFYELGIKFASIGQ